MEKFIIIGSQKLSFTEIDLHRFLSTTSILDSWMQMKCTLSFCTSCLKCLYFSLQPIPLKLKSLSSLLLVFLQLLATPNSIFGFHISIFFNEIFLLSFVQHAYSFPKFPFFQHYRFVLFVLIIQFLHRVAIKIWVTSFCRRPIQCPLLLHVSPFPIFVPLVYFLFRLLVAWQTLYFSHNFVSFFDAFLLFFFGYPNHLLLHVEQLTTY